MVDWRPTLGRDLSVEDKLLLLSLFICEFKYYRFPPDSLYVILRGLSRLPGILCTALDTLFRFSLSKLLVSSRIAILTRGLRESLPFSKIEFLSSTNRSISSSYSIMLLTLRANFGSIALSESFYCICYFRLSEFDDVLVLILNEWNLCPLAANVDWRLIPFLADVVDSLGRTIGLYLIFTFVRSV